jgi:hypothetical protein
MIRRLSRMTKTRHSANPPRWQTFVLERTGRSLTVLVAPRGSVLSVDMRDWPAPTEGPSSAFSVLGEPAWQSGQTIAIDDPAPPPRGNTLRVTRYRP